MRSAAARQLLSRTAIVLFIALACLVSLNVASGRAATSPTYPTAVFSDGFESGSLSAWDGTGGGNGSVSVLPGAAHTGTYGAQIANASGQYNLIVKNLPSALPDSQTTFWTKIGSGGGIQTLAEGRDESSSQTVWSILYDGAHQGLYFYPYNGAGASTEIYTGANTVPTNTWVQIAVQYTATGTGGAQLYVNGQTNATWGVSGDYTRGSNFQRLQLWNDAVDTTAFDDVAVAAPPATAATAPGAPTGVQGSAGDSSVSLAWVIPSSNGGSAITGYQITPYINGSAQSPIVTNSSATSYTINGLINGTTYTFTVAAINAVGTGAQSSPSAALTPVAATAPGAPTNVQGTPGDGAISLSWTAPTSNGNSPITAYRITPYVNGVGQTATVTSSSATTQYMSGLTNGTTYTFTVAAINAVGTGSASTPSAAVTPAAQSTYSSAVFSDGFESGSLSAWDGTGGGNGSASVTSAAAHTGSYGARISNTSGQYNLFVKSLPSALPDSEVTFWTRVSSGGGVQTLAEARDQSSSQTMWSLLYDPGQHGLYFYPYNGSGSSTEVFTGANTMPLNTWVQIAVSYTATSAGGAQLYINGQTNHAWGVIGDYTRTGNLQRVQLWNDSTSTTDFDDVTVAAPTPKIPGAPSAVYGSAGNGSVSLTWNAPSSDGGSAITGYQVTPYVNGTSQAPILTNSTSTSYTVTGLTNGTGYTFTVAAINATGTGAASAQSGTVTPQTATAPGAPTNVQGAAYDGAVNVAWTAPASDGGSPITGYRITPWINGAAQKPVVTSTSATAQFISGLTDGTTYTFTVAAINAVATSPDSTASAGVTPVALSTKYTNVLFADGFESASLSAWDGIGGSSGTVAVTRAAEHSGTYGARITNASGQYGLIAKTLAAPVVDSAVTFWARIGAGGATQTLAMARDGSSSHVLWSLLYDGAHQGLYFYPYAKSGSSTEIFTGANSVPINTWVQVTVDYTATAAGGAQIYVNGQTNSAWGVTGDYSQTANLQRLQLWNDSLSTTDFDDVTIAAAPTAPAAPSNVQGTAGDKSVALTWTAPASNGGSPITNYQVTPYVKGIAQTPILTNSTSTSDTVTGLTDGTAYTFAVAGINANGTGPNSAQSAAITPVAPTAPAAPTGVQATAQNQAVALTWTAPASDGGSSITNYQVTPYINGTAQAPIVTNSTATNYTITGLANGTYYTFGVAAVNAVGTGAASSPSVAVAPFAPVPPYPPSSVQGTAQNAAVALTWTAPSSDGGSSITNYQVTPYINGTAQAPVLTNSLSTNYTVTGLTNGTAYTFAVAAINAIGTGSTSGQSAAVTPAAPTPPGAPTGVTGTAGNATVSLNWVAPSSNGGSPITGYQVTPYINGTAQSPVATNSTSTSYTVTGLTNGTAYTFTVAAVNAIGTGSASSPSSAMTPVPNPPNAIVLENQQPGTTSWQFTTTPSGTPLKATNHQIEGYASGTSVNQGGQISFMVSLSASAQFNMDIYRMGWYPKGTNPDGTSCAPSCGGRLMQHVGPLSGATQPGCPAVSSSSSPDYGMIECQWSPNYTLTVPTSWTSGVYLVKMTRLDDGLQNYMTFVVRGDSSTARIVYSLDTTTWQAYNLWGGGANNDVGISLYGRTNDVTGNSVNGSRAYSVSFDRPYWDSGETDGAGLFMEWDFPMIRWMESQGYDMTYITSTDLESNANVLSGHRVFVNTGHDEYYSDNMRTNITNAINSGINMALFSANDFFYRITWASDASGAPLRRIHCDKGATAGSTTIQWRILTPALPENMISGVMQNGTANNEPFLVGDASSWIFAGSGLVKYSGNGTSGVVTSGPGQNALPGLVGYEFDERASNDPGLAQWDSFEPTGLDQVGHSFVPANDNGGANAWSDAVVRTAPSGASIFAAGTIEWSYGVDDGYPDGFCDCDHSYANAAAQQVTKNILDRFSQ